MAPPCAINLFLTISEVGAKRTANWEIVSFHACMWAGGRTVLYIRSFPAEQSSLTHVFLSLFAPEVFRFHFLVQEVFPFRLIGVALPLGNFLTYSSLTIVASQLSFRTFPFGVSFRNYCIIGGFPHGDLSLMQVIGLLSIRKHDLESSLREAP